MSCCCSSLESWKLLRPPSLFKLIKAVLVVWGNHWQIYVTHPSTFLYDSLVTHCEKILPHHWKAASTVFLSLFFALRSSGKGSLDVIRSLPGRPAGSESAEIDRLMYQLGSCEITEHFPGWIGFCSPVRLNDMIQVVDSICYSDHVDLLAFESEIILFLVNKKIRLGNAWTPRTCQKQSYIDISRHGQLTWVRNHVNSW